MGLAGPLGPRAPDKWRNGKPTAQAAPACMAALRASFRARLLEATDGRRTEKALTWIGRFVTNTERVPFVDPADEGGGYSTTPKRSPCSLNISGRERVRGAARRCALTPSPPT
eukprot:3209717-Pleurochrysis_carterae.AAC.1